jgi:uncharacterized protein YndB with AHSA1/START domain
VARTAGPEPQIGLRAWGTVAVTAAMRTAVEETWRALLEPERIEQWFGTISGELAPGAHARLDFEDGDFFDIDVERAEQPVLRWTWRFMGCGPADRIDFRVERSAGRSIVTVTDANPDRSGEAALEMGQGWRDFLTRLQRYLANGERSRYDWRSDVDIWIELGVDADAARRLLIGAASDWLPLEAGAANLITAEAIVLDDGQEPMTFAISDVEGTGPMSVRFKLRPTGIDGALLTWIDVATRGDGATLAISQTGFRNLPVDDAVQRSLRARFAAAWLAAVRRAAELPAALHASR